MTQFVTTGDIARELRWPLHRVTYAVQRLGIDADARVGTYRLFRRERLKDILTMVQTLSTRKGPDNE